MRDAQARKEIIELRSALGTLCRILGISFQESYWSGEISIGAYTHIEGGNPDRRPLTTKLGMELERKINAIGKLAADESQVNGIAETQRLLLQQLGFKVENGKHLVKIKKGRK